MQPKHLKHWEKKGVHLCDSPKLLHLMFVCLCWGLTSQSTIFQSCRDGATASWVINQYFWGVKCLAQGHNTAEVGFEPPTSRSGVLHSTTEPRRSPAPDVPRTRSHFYHNRFCIHLLLGPHTVCQLYMHIILMEAVLNFWRYVYLKLSSISKRTQRNKF